MTNSNLLGIHHITAMTKNAQRNYHFFTEILGMRLVKKQSTKTISTPITPFLLMTKEMLELI